MMKTTANINSDKDKLEKLTISQAKKTTATMTNSDKETLDRLTTSQAKPSAYICISVLTAYHSGAALQAIFKLLSKNVSSFKNVTLCIGDGIQKNKLRCEYEFTKTSSDEFTEMVLNKNWLHYNSDNVHTFSEACTKVNITLQTHNWVKAKQCAEEFIKTTDTESLLKTKVSSDNGKAEKLTDGGKLDFKSVQALAESIYSLYRKEINELAKSFSEKHVNPNPLNPLQIEKPIWQEKLFDEHGLQRKAKLDEEEYISESEKCLSEELAMFIFQFLEAKSDVYFAYPRLADSTKLFELAKKIVLEHINTPYQIIHLKITLNLRRRSTHESEPTSTVSLPIQIPKSIDSNPNSPVGTPDILSRSSTPDTDTSESSYSVGPLDSFLATNSPTNNIEDKKRVNEAHPETDTTSKKPLQAPSIGFSSPMEMETPNSQRSSPQNSQPSSHISVKKTGNSDDAKKSEVITSSILVPETQRTQVITNTSLRDNSQSFFNGYSTSKPPLTPEPTLTPELEDEAFKLLLRFNRVATEKQEQGINPMEFILYLSAKKTKHTPTPQPSSVNRIEMQLTTS